MSSQEIATPSPTGVMSALETMRSPVDAGLAASAGVISLLIGYGAFSLLLHRHGLLALLVALLAWLVGISGFCAVMARRLQALHEVPQGGIFEAALGGFFAALRVLLVMLLLIAGLLVLLLGAGLLFLVTQIPGIGPALDYVVFPLLALVLGVVIYTLAFIAFPLACAAACDGRGVFATVATILLATRSRLFDIALRGVLVWLLAMLVMGLAATIASIGIGTAAGLQGIVHISSSGAATAGYGGYGNYGGGPYAAMGGGQLAMLAPIAAKLMAGGVTSLLLYFVAVSLGIVVYAGGWVAIYEESLRKLDPAALEAQMRNQADRIRQTARAAQERASRMAREQTSRHEHGASGKDAKS